MGRFAAQQRRGSGVVKAAAKDTRRGKRCHYSVVGKLAAGKSAGKHWNHRDKKVETSTRPGSR